MIAFYDLGPLALILQLPVISRLNIYQRPSFFEIAAPYAGSRYWMPLYLLPA